MIEYVSKEMKTMEKTTIKNIIGWLDRQIANNKTALREARLRREITKNFNVENRMGSLLNYAVIPYFLLLVLGGITATPLEVPAFLMYLGISYCAGFVLQKTDDKYNRIKLSSFSDADTEEEVAKEGIKRTVEYDKIYSKILALQQIKDVLSREAKLEVMGEVSSLESTNELENKVKKIRQKIEEKGKTIDKLITESILAKSFSGKKGLCSRIGRIVYKFTLGVAGLSVFYLPAMSINPGLIPVALPMCIVNALLYFKRILKEGDDQIKAYEELTRYEALDDAGLSEEEVQESLQSTIREIVDLYLLLDRTHEQLEKKYDEDAAEPSLVMGVEPVYEHEPTRVGPTLGEDIKRHTILPVDKSEQR